MVVESTRRCPANALPPSRMVQTLTSILPSGVYSTHTWTPSGEKIFGKSQVGTPWVTLVWIDETLPLTVGEFEEWGNPKVKEQFDYIASYCPYTNLAPGAYPAMLVKTSFHDSQVMYWEPAKYVAKLRTLKTNDTQLLFQTNLAGGHGGSSGRYDAWCRAVDCVLSWSAGRADSRF